MKKDDREVKIGSKDPNQEIEIINRQEVIGDQLMSGRRKLKDDQEVDREAVAEIEEEDDMTHRALGSVLNYRTNRCIILLFRIYSIILNALKLLLIVKRLVEFKFKKSFTEITIT